MNFAKLLDDQLTADFHYNAFPNVTFNLFGEQTRMFRHRPHPTDPDRMSFDRMVFNRVPGVGSLRQPHMNDCAVHYAVHYEVPRAGH